MSYPTNSTLEQLNQKNLDSVIKWPEYLGQTFSKGVLSFVAVEGAASYFQYNVGELKELEPTLKGAILPKVVTNTTLFIEPFSRFGEASVLDTADILTGNGVEQLEQQTRSIEVRILRELNHQFFIGNGVAPNLKGIHARFSTTIAVAGPITLSFLYQARYSIKPSNESGLGWGGNAWFSNATMFRRVLELFGHHSSQIEWKFHQGLGVQVPEILGMPWYIDANIPIGPAQGTTIYAMNLDHVRILYATHPDYCANNYGLIRLPIPSQGSVSEFGELILGIYAIQNDPGSIVRLTRVGV